MNWDEANRPDKVTTRALAVKGYRQQHSAIFLPGWDDTKEQAGADIRYALSHDHLNLSKPLIAVERDRNIYPLIKEDLETLGFIDLRMHRGQLETLKLTETVDFAFIDLFGGLDQGLLRWIEKELQPRIITETMLSLTVGYAIRNDFMRKSVIALEKHYPHLLDWAEGELQLRKPERQVPYILMRMALNGHHVALTERLPYQDSRVSMLYYKFSDFIPGNGVGWPSLDEFFAFTDLVELRNDGNGGVTGNNGRSDIAKATDKLTDGPKLRLVWHDDGVSLAFGDDLILTGSDLHQLQSKAMTEVLGLTGTS